MATRQRWTLVAAAAAAVGGVGELLRRQRSARVAPPLPLSPAVTTQSSPGQIADLQQVYGADMAPEPAHHDPSPS